MSCGHFCEVGSGFWGVPPGPQNMAPSRALWHPKLPDLAIFGLEKLVFQRTCWFPMRQFFLGNSSPAHSLSKSCLPSCFILPGRQKFGTKNVDFWNFKPYIIQRTYELSVYYFCLRQVVQVTATSASLLRLVTSLVLKYILIGYSLLYFRMVYHPFAFINY